MVIPNEVKTIISALQKNGFEAYIVGGCVRDFLLGVEPQDWDVATNAKPEKVQEIMEKSGFKTFYENEFWTVGVLRRKTKKQTEVRPLSDDVVEITTYRSEAKYSDKRHPDEIKPAKTIEEDLARRDFTFNAIAAKIKGTKLEFVDPFNGQEDLKNKIIRAVGKPEERFSEDALRMMRAVRFATTLGGSTALTTNPEHSRRVGSSTALTTNPEHSRRVGSSTALTTNPEHSRRVGFEIEEETAKAIKKNSGWLKMISKERIRDEFLKIIMADKTAEGIELLRELGLLKFIVPELEEGFGIGQNKHHIYDCWEHSLRSLDYAANPDVGFRCRGSSMKSRDPRFHREKGFIQNVRLAALFHDIAKPRVKEGEGPDSTFYNHEIVGAKMTSQILDRLRFPKKDIEKVVKLVRYHLFYYNVDEVTEASVRRLVRNVGPENMEELLQVRMADRIGSGVPKAEPYKLRHLKYVVERVSRDPISTKMLKVNGNDVMRLLGIKPSPKIGQILDVLLGMVLADPKKNKKELLEKEVKKLGKLSEKELSSLANEAKKEREKIETKKDEMTKAKYWVT